MSQHFLNFSKRMITIQYSEQKKRNIEKHRDIFKHHITYLGMNRFPHFFPFRKYVFFDCVYFHFTIIFLDDFRFNSEFSSLYCFVILIRILQINQRKNYKMQSVFNLVYCHVCLSEYLILQLDLHFHLYSFSIQYYKMHLLLSIKITHSPPPPEYENELIRVWRKTDI